MAAIVTRFAPSPTGFLHLGHAHAALVAWQLARGRGGRFLLRLEDIDPTRCRPEFAAGILEDLAWLGLDWDGPVRVQSEHLGAYRDVLGRLAGEGLLYPCFCSRADILRAAAAPHAGEVGPIYPGTCRRLSASERAERIAAGEPHALRLAMDLAARRAGPLEFLEFGHVQKARPEAFGDVVLARKDAPASYHLCVAHDDAAQGVTVVTRGIDLLPATHLHRLLQALLGWPPPRYAHHPLLTDAAGRRLAKRDRAPAIRDLRAGGHTPREVWEMAGFSPAVHHGTLCPSRSR